MRFSALFSAFGVWVGRAIGITKVFSKVFRLSTVQQLGMPISNDESFYYGFGRTAGFIIGSASFGALHIAAWNFIFPTRAEQIIWQTTSLFCTLIYPIYAALPLILPRGATPEVIYVMGSALYVLARLFLIVEIFRTLCFLPPSAYVATWASNIPHVA